MKNEKEIEVDVLQKKQVDREIQDLCNKLMMTSTDFYKIKSDANGGLFNPIEWTTITLLSYLNALFIELDKMGVTINKSHGKDLYAKKVLKFMKAVTEEANKMTRLNGCFELKENIH